MTIRRDGVFYVAATLCVLAAIMTMVAIGSPAIFGRTIAVAIGLTWLVHVVYAVTELSSSRRER